VGQTTQQLGEYGNAAKQKTVDTRAAARGALGIDDTGNLVEGTGAIGGTQKDIADQFASRQTAQAADDTAIRQALTSGDYSKLTPAQLAVVGQQAQNGEGNYGVDATKYLTKAELTAQNTQSPEQQRRLAALGALAGMDDLGAPIGDNDVGKYDTESSVGLNFDALTNAIGQGKQRFEADLTTALNDNNYKAPSINDGGTTYQPGGGPTKALEDVKARIASVQADMAKGVPYSQTGPRLAELQKVQEQIEADIQNITYSIQQRYGVAGAAALDRRGPTVFNKPAYRAPVVKA